MFEQNDLFVRKATNFLNNPLRREELFNLVKNRFGETLYIAFPNVGRERNKFYFIIDTDNEDILSLKHDIKKLLGFDYENDDSDNQDVVILNKRIYDASSIRLLASDITKFALENAQQVQDFLTRHYGQYIDKPQKNEKAKSNNSTEVKNGENSFWKKDKDISTSNNKHHPKPTKSTMNITEAMPPKSTKPAV